MVELTTESAQQKGNTTMTAIKAKHHVRIGIEPVGDAPDHHGYWAFGLDDHLPMYSLVWTEVESLLSSAAQHQFNTADNPFGWRHYRLLVDGPEETSSRLIRLMPGNAKRHVEKLDESGMPIPAFSVVAAEGAAA